MEKKLIERLSDLSGVENKNFRSKIEANNITVYGGTDEEEYVLQAMVEWNAEPEYRSWGIKDITPSVYSVNVMLEEGDIDLSEYNISTEYKSTEHSPSLYPHSLEIDINKKEIIVSFVK